MLSFISPWCAYSERAAPRSPVIACRTFHRLPPASPPVIEQTIGDFSFHLDGGKMITSNKAGRNINKEILRRWKKSGFIAAPHLREVRTVLRERRLQPDSRRPPGG